MLVCHPGDPSVPLRVNRSEAHLYKPWVEPVAESEPSGLRALFEAQGWTALRKIAAEIGYEKPEGQSWEESIPEMEAMA